MNRREALRIGGQLLGAASLGALGWRVFSPSSEKTGFIAQNRRFAWQIDPEKCLACGRCATACVRKPSSAKAVNDPKKCSNCVVCYGHISDTQVDSDKIDTEGKRVCPVDAVQRENFSGGADGLFLYRQDPKRCIGCAQCVKRCNEHGSKSMFMIIRPDLCLGCNECAIAVACPHGAVIRIPRAPVDDYRGDYGIDQAFLTGDGA
jgi:electron transport complex protein RnfB